MAFAAAMTLAAILAGRDTSPPRKALRESVNQGPKPDDYRTIIRDYLKG